MRRREFIAGAAALAAAPAFAKRTEDIRAVFLPWGHNMWGEALPEGVTKITNGYLNFSTAHDAWLGEYGRMVTTTAWPTWSSSAAPTSRQSGSRAF